MDDDQGVPKTDRCSPRNFLRARRPERFSDSVVVERPTLDRAILEYHLDSLTSRNDRLQALIDLGQLSARSMDEALGQYVETTVDENWNFILGCS